MRAINLLPKDDARRGGKTPDLIVLVSVLVFVVLTAAICGLFLMAHGKVVEKQQELKAAQQELKLIPIPTQTQVEANNALATDKKARVAALSSALGKRVAWDRVLREFSLVLPSEVWLTELSGKAPSSALAAPTPGSASTGATAASGGATTHEFEIEGYTYSHDGVALLLTRLSVVPDLANVQLELAERQKVQGQYAIHFRIAADVRTPGTAT